MFLIFALHFRDGFSRATPSTVCDCRLAVFAAFCCHSVGDKVVEMVFVVLDSVASAVESTEARWAAKLQSELDSQRSEWEIERLAQLNKVRCRLGSVADWRGRSSTAMPSLLCTFCYMRSWERHTEPPCESCRRTLTSCRRALRRLVEH